MVWRPEDLKDADGMANSIDPEEQSDLGLHCLFRPVCRNAYILRYRIPIMHETRISVLF